MTSIQFRSDNLTEYYSDSATTAHFPVTEADISAIENVPHRWAKAGCWKLTERRSDFVSEILRRWTAPC